MESDSYVTFVPVDGKDPKTQLAHLESINKDPPPHSIYSPGGQTCRNLTPPGGPETKQLLSPDVMSLRDPLPTPNAAPLGDPLPTPNTAPLRDPLPTPNAAPLRDPVPTPNAAPLRDPVPTPNAAPLRDPLPTPNAAPLRDPLPTPNAASLRDPLPTPNAAPLRDPLPTPNAAPLKDPLPTPNAAPLRNPLPTPNTAPLRDPLPTPNAASLRDPLPTPNAAPLRDPLPTPNAAPLRDPLPTPNAASLRDPLPTPNATHLRNSAIIQPVPHRGSKSSPSSKVRQTVYTSGDSFASAEGRGQMHQYPTLGPHPSPKSSEDTLRSKVAVVETMSKLPPRSATVGRKAGGLLVKGLLTTGENDTVQQSPPLPPRNLSGQSKPGGDGDGGGGGGLKQSPAPSFVAASPVASLSDITRWYGGAFPIDVHVHSGLRTSKRTPEHEFLRINGLHQSQVLQAESFSGYGFHIPLNTDMRLALLYDPYDDRVAAVQGYEFDGLASVLAQVPRPALLGVVEAWSSSSATLKEGEIVVVMDTDRSGTRVYSMTEKVTKLLPLDCPAFFTTKALNLCLPISDLVAYVPLPPLAKACILKYDNGPKCYPSNVVHLKGVGVAPVLLCTPICQVVADGDVGVATVFHLPLKLPGLKVVVIETQTDGGPGPVGVWGPGVDWSRATVCAEEWSEDLPSYERIGDFKVKGKPLPAGDYVPLLISAAVKPSSDYCTLTSVGTSWELSENMGEGSCTKEEKESINDRHQQTTPPRQTPLFPDMLMAANIQVPQPLLSVLPSKESLRSPVQPDQLLSNRPPLTTPTSDTPSLTTPPPRLYMQLSTAPPSIGGYSSLSPLSKEVTPRGRQLSPLSREATPRGSPVSPLSREATPSGSISNTQEGERLVGSPGDSTTEGSLRATEGSVYDHFQPKQLQKIPSPLALALAPAPSSLLTPAPVPEDQQSKNLKVLKRLTLPDVLSLLDTLGMGVYKPTFEREHLSGSVLSLVTQDILEELQVIPEHSRVLLDIITGVRSLPSTC